MLVTWRFGNAHKSWPPAPGAKLGWGEERERAQLGRLVGQGRQAQLGTAGRGHSWAGHSGSRPPPAGRKQEEPLGSEPESFQKNAGTVEVGTGFYGMKLALCMLWVKLRTNFCISGNTKKACKIGNTVKVI